MAGPAKKRKASPGGDASKPSPAVRRAETANAPTPRADGAASAPAPADGAAKKRKAVDAPAAGAEPSHGQAAAAGDGPAKRRQAKEVAAARKLKRKPIMEVVVQLVPLWEKLRNKATAVADRPGLSAQVLSLSRGHVLELSKEHTASRCLQASLKHGGPAARAALLAEAAPHFLELATSTHGNFLARRLVDAATRAELTGLIAGLRGHVLKLARHPCGSAVLEQAYAAAAPAAQAAIAAEFYGPEFGLGLGDVLGGAITPASKPDVTPATTSTHASTPGQPLRLAGVIARAPSRRVAILGHCQRALTPVLEKGMVDHTLIHRVLSDFLALAGPQAAADAAETLMGEPALRMAHTRDGASAVCAMVAAGGAKDRKKLAKALKGHVGRMARDEHACGVLAALCDCADDTALLRKTVVAEISADLWDLVTDARGRRAVLHLLAPKCGRYFSPSFLAMLPGAGAVSMTRAMTLSGTQSLTQSGTEAEGAAEGTTSKKPAVVRRRELLGGGGAGGGGGLIASLAAMVTSRAPEMLSSAAACDVLLEVITGGHAADAAGPGGLESARAAVVAAAAAPRSGGEGDHPLLQFVGSRAMRRLAGAAAAAAGERPFASRLWEGALRGRCSEWVGSHADKVLATVAGCGDAITAAEARAELACAVAPVAVDDWLASFGGGFDPSKAKARKAKGKAGQGAGKAAGKGADKAAAGAKRPRAEGYVVPRPEPRAMPVSVPVAKAAAPAAAGGLIRVLGQPH